MAVVSDVAYGARTYTRELATELKQKGLIDEKSTIDSVDDVRLTAWRKLRDAATGIKQKGGRKIFEGCFIIQLTIVNFKLVIKTYTFVFNNG